MTGMLPGIHNATEFVDTVNLVLDSNSDSDSKSIPIAATPATDCIKLEFQSPHA